MPLLNPGVVLIVKSTCSEKLYPYSLNLISISRVNKLRLPPYEIPFTVFPCS